MTDETEIDETPETENLEDEVKRLRNLVKKSRVWEQRAKENADAAARLADLENSQKSDIEKLTERAESATREAEQARMALLRLEVAIDKGLTPTQARRLTGANREEFEADADELIAAFTAPEKPAPKGKPQQRLQPAGEPEEEPDETDPRKLAALIPR